jgi:hypothetical protein
MSPIPTIEPLGGVNPLLHRDYPSAPAGDTLYNRHDKPVSRAPRERKRKPGSAVVVPAVAPHSTFGHVVNTFAGARITHSIAMHI